MNTPMVPSSVSSISSRSIIRSVSSAKKVNRESRWLDADHCDAFSATPLKDALAVSLPTEL
jgi:hypothetical protein